MPDDTEIIVDLLLEYLEALVNQILYLRQIYDRDIFQRERLYGIAVHRSRHPELTSYISESLSSLRVSLASICGFMKDDRSWGRC